MGSEALNVLTTRRTQELPSTQASVLQGIEDAFRGQLRLGEQERNKALFDVSQQVFQNLNKIEQKNISAGKKYQQAFARKKMWSLKRASTAASITLGKGKISGNDPGYRGDQRDADGRDGDQRYGSERSGAYAKAGCLSPVFREPLKRLQNHGSVTLVVPPEKAYGSKGLPPKIPPGRHHGLFRADSR